LFTNDLKGYKLGNIDLFEEIDICMDGANNTPVKIKKSAVIHKTVAPDN